MNQYGIAIHSPDDFGPSKHDPAMFRDITALDEEMKTARPRIFLGGMDPAAKAKSLRVEAAGKVAVSDLPHTEAKEQIGGFWALACADVDQALVWTGNAAVACRAPVEVRQVLQQVQIEWPRI